MIYNNNKSYFNTNNGYKGIVFGKRYISFLSKGTNTIATFRLTSLQDTSIVVYWGDDTKTVYSPPFNDVTISKNYSNTNLYNIVIECELFNIKELIFTTFFNINLLEIFRSMPNLNILSSNVNTNISQNTSNILFPQNLNTLSIQSNNISGNINTWQISDSLEVLNISGNPLNGIISELNINNLKVLDARFNSITNQDLSLINFPDTIEEIYLGAFVFGGQTNAYSIEDISRWDFGGSNLKILNLIGFSDFNIVGNMNNINIPNTIERLSVINNFQEFVIFNNYTNLEYNINSLDIESKVNLKIIELDFLSGNISNITLPNNLEILTMKNSNIEGDFKTVTIPSTLDKINLNFIYNNNFSFDITGYDFKNLRYIYLKDNKSYGNPSSLLNNNSNTKLWVDCSENNITGLINYAINILIVDLSFNNLTIDFDNISLNCLQLNLSYNNSVGYFENCSFTGVTNSLVLNDMNIYGNFIFSNFSNLKTLILKNNNINGDLTNLISSGVLSTDSNIILSLNNNNFTGDISEWDVSKIDTLNISNNNFTGSLSGWTLSTSWITINLSNLSNITDISHIINIIFNNRTIYSYFISKILSIQNNVEIINNPTIWIIKQGDLGTYIDDINLIDENSINNLKNGNDFDGQGTNIPWTPGETIWWIQNAKQQSNPTIRRYFQLTVNI